MVAACQAMRLFLGDDFFGASRLHHDNTIPPNHEFDTPHSRIIDITPSNDIEYTLDGRMVMVGFESRIRSALSAEVAGRLQLHLTIKSLPRR
jgi:hypothetical protein